MAYDDSWSPLADLGVTTAWPQSVTEPFERWTPLPAMSEATQRRWAALDAYRGDDAATAATLRMQQAVKRRNMGGELSPKAAQTLSDLFVPHTVADVAMLAPGGLLTKAILATLWPSEAEAGPIGSIRKAAGNAGEEIVKRIIGPGPSRYVPSWTSEPILPGDIRASTRLPTSLRALENPLTHHLNVGLTEALATPGFARNLQMMSDYPGLAFMKDLPAEEAARAYIDFARQNLNFIHRHAPAAIQQRSPFWAEGAHEFADALAQRYGVPIQSVGGAIATLSPETRWFTNASRAERVGDILFGPASSRPMTSEMLALARSTPSLMSPANADVVSRITGKSLSQLTNPIDQAIWTRLYDEVHNPRIFRTMTPEGMIGDVVLSASGEPQRLSWGRGEDIAKALQSYQSGGDMNIISRLLGAGHKVRSIYNDIVLPNDTRFLGNVTADRRQVAGSLLRPLSANTPEVAHNLASSLRPEFQPPGYRGAAGSTISGIQGTYPLNVEAARASAADLGLMPNQVKGVTWDSVGSSSLRSSKPLET